VQKAEGKCHPLRIARTQGSFQELSSCPAHRTGDFPQPRGFPEYVVSTLMWGSARDGPPGSVEALFWSNIILLCGGSLRSQGAQKADRTGISMQPLRVCRSRDITMSERFGLHFESDLGIEMRRVQ
jgi:hypothetical protein